MDFDKLRQINEAIAKRDKHRNEIKFIDENPHIASEYAIDMLPTLREQSAYWNGEVNRLLKELHDEIESNPLRQWP